MTNGTRVNLSAPRCTSYVLALETVKGREIPAARQAGPEEFIALAALRQIIGVENRAKDCRVESDARRSDFDPRPGPLAGSHHRQPPCDELHREHPIDLSPKMLAFGPAL